MLANTSGLVHYPPVSYLWFSTVFTDILSLFGPVFGLFLLLWLNIQLYFSSGLIQYSLVFQLCFFQHPLVLYDLFLLASGMHCMSNSSTPRNTLIHLHHLSFIASYSFSVLCP